MHLTILDIWEDIRITPSSAVYCSYVYGVDFIMVQGDVQREKINYN